ncbi:MAG: hypothetical protein O2894_07325, partial [Planctomycetota bacterium]|nr:hypothetical protein [Planctomycetota bacterium]
DPTPPPPPPTTPPPSPPPPTTPPPAPPPPDDPPPPTTPPSDGRPPQTTPPDDPEPEPEPPEPEDDTPTTPSGDAPDEGEPTPTGGQVPGTTPTGPDLPGGNATGGGDAPELGGSRRRRSGGGEESIEWRWQTWWAFNRWNYLPSRNDNLRRTFKRFRVATGEVGDGLGAWDQRRDALARLRATPALIRILLDDLRPGDEGIKAAAALALARISTETEAVEAVLRAAEDPKQELEVRESAAFAAGLFRRTNGALRMSGERMDQLRTRLLTLADDEATPR